MKHIGILFLLLCFSFSACKQVPKLNIDEVLNDSIFLSITLDNGSVIYTYDEYVPNNEPLFYILSDDNIDTFRVSSNTCLMNLYKSKSDSIVYLVSCGGSASCGMVTRINIVTKTFSFNDYEAWGFAGCKTIGDCYIISCKTNPMHSDELISFQWTDTLNNDFELINSSDTVKVKCD